MDWEQAADLIMQGITQSVLSEDVMYRKKNTLNWFAIRGIFSRQYTGVDSTTGESYVGNMPGLTVRDSDIPDGPEVDDQVIARNVQYRVDVKQEDGQSSGHALLLKKVS